MKKHMAELFNKEKYSAIPIPYFPKTSIFVLQMG
jgi:hypothetical protein